MNFRKMKQNDLAAFAENIVNLLQGTELEVLDSQVRAALLTAFGSLPATLAEQTNAAQVAVDVAMALVADRNDTAAKLYKAIGQLRDGLKSSLASKSVFNLCGLGYPERPVGTYMAQDPTELSGKGESNGVNRLRFAGNNKRGRVMYEVWRRTSPNGPWTYLTSIRRQRFIDSPVTPGQYYEYKVKAIAARSVSHYSNRAVVYGTL